MARALPYYLPGLCTVGPNWSGKHIHKWCNNQSVVATINSKHSKSSQVLDLVKTLSVTSHLILPTSLGWTMLLLTPFSCFQMDLFYALVPTAFPIPCFIPPSAMNI